jgi:hypothetical protein
MFNFSDSAKRQWLRPPIFKLGMKYSSQNYSPFVSWIGQRELKMGFSG